MRSNPRLLLALSGLLGAAHAWYLPGVAPHDFTRGERVDLKVNKLTSTRTQVPYDYYTLPFCKPAGGVVMSAENLGEFLTGDRIDNSPYQLYMRDDSTCNILCQQVYGKKDVEVLEAAIDENYHHNWIIDNLPAASIVETSGFVETSYSKGFPVGFKTPKGWTPEKVQMHDKVNKHLKGMGGMMKEMDETADYFLYNHVELIVKYHELGPDSNRVVGFYVQPRSVRHYFANGEHWNPNSPDDYMPYLTTCEKYASDPINAAAKDNAEWANMYGDDGKQYGVKEEVEPQKVEPGTVLFTYDVSWRPSDIHWASRWDIYLSMNNAVPAKVHWFSIVNSLMIVVFLAALVGMILLRAVYGDISRYNQRSDEVKPMTDEQKAEEREESGWKLVHANVFATPAHPLAFCVAVGTGQQLLFSAVAVAGFAAVGFLSPANRGSLMLAMLCLFCLFSFGGGYRAARLHRAFRGESFEAPGLSMAFAFPGAAFAVFVVANVLLHVLQSSGAVPLGTMFALVFFWFACAAPLSVAGAYLGFAKEPALEFPLRADAIPRPIPDQPWFLGLVPTVVLGGILPFGACFVELFFILSSMWMDQYYYVMGFTLLVFLILLVTCAEITVVLVYFQLCAEDYNWWWRSFLASGSTAVYVFLYSALYFSKLEANLAVTYVIYFGYMLLLSMGLFMLCGSVGYLSAYYFIVAIYSSVKLD